MNKCHAVLIDTVSIQQYVFASNKLKENLGASFLVENIYGTHLKNAVKAVFGQSFGDTCNLHAWKENPDDIVISKVPFEIAYIGGGNALLLFQDQAVAEKFLKIWTSSLLVHCPGLVTAVASGTMDLDHFAESKNTLFRILAHNKSMYSPVASIPTHGITAQCTHSGLSYSLF